MLLLHYNANNQIQIFHLGRYIIGYNICSAKLNFRQYVRRYTTQNEKFEYNYTTITNFSTKYLMVCKVYTDVGGIK